MGKYAESNLQQGEGMVREARITPLFAILRLTNIFIIPLIVRLIKWSHMELAITNRRIIGKIGVIKVQTLDAPLNRVQDCSVSQTFWGRICNYGTVSIRTAAASFSFSGVKDANAFKNAVLAQVEQYEADRVQQQALQMAQAMASTNQNQ